MATYLKLQNLICIFVELFLRNEEFNLKCFSMTRQFLKIFFIKKCLLILHHCVAVFSRSNHKELKIANSLKNACKVVPFLLKWQTGNETPPTLLKKYLHILLTYIFKSFVLSLSSFESLQRLILFQVCIQIQPGKYMFVEYLWNIPMR